MCVSADDLHLHIQIPQGLCVSTASEHGVIPHIILSAPNLLIFCRALSEDTVSYANMFGHEVNTALTVCWGNFYSTVPAFCLEGLYIYCNACLC